MEVHMKALRFALYGILGGLLVACGSSPATTAASSPSPKGTVVVVTKTDATHGTFLVAATNQMTLYVFTKDTPGVSNCSGGCLKNWPALSVAAGTAIAAGPGITGQLSTFTRTEGLTQVTYKGMPLYFFITDVKVGDTTGVGKSNWELAKP
jgi:predicted lipoprotein with Yx(FWY)xxD motif